MNKIYVILFLSSGRLADNIFFNSLEEAIEYKKQQILTGEVLNSLDVYDFLSLSETIKVLS